MLELSLVHCVGNFASFDLHSQFAGGLGPGQVPGTDEWYGDAECMMCSNANSEKKIGDKLRQTIPA